MLHDLIKATTKRIAEERKGWRYRNMLYSKRLKYTVFKKLYPVCFCNNFLIVNQFSYILAKM